MLHIRLQKSCDFFFNSSNICAHERVSFRAMGQKNISELPKARVKKTGAILDKKMTKTEMFCLRIEPQSPKSENRKTLLLRMRSTWNPAPLANWPNGRCTLVKNFPIGEGGFSPSKQNPSLLGCGRRGEGGGIFFLCISSYGFESNNIFRQWNLAFLKKNTRKYRKIHNVSGAS